MLTLANAIIASDESRVREALSRGADVNGLDEYGFIPLVEAALVNDLALTQLLLHHGAHPNYQDSVGNTALHWAAENNNLAIARALFAKGADANAVNLAGQPVLTMPYLRQQTEIKNLLLQNGASLEFTKDYVNTKLLGHFFELIGIASMVTPNRKFVEVDFEGFLPEVTLAIITDSLQQFNHHFAARRLREVPGALAISEKIMTVMQRAARLIRYQHYRIDVAQHQSEILGLLRDDPLVIPVAYEGHAITFIRMQNLLVKCDRREDSRVYDNIVIYKMGRPERLNADFIQQLIYRKQFSDSINHKLPAWLQLVPLTELHVPAQVSGNCSWANVEACVPALYFLLAASNITQGEKFSEVHHLKDEALDYFDRWREWNRDRALQFCLQRFREVNAVRKACHAEMLTAILFQSCNTDVPRDIERAERILSVLLDSPYTYVLQSYVKAYVYEDTGEEGRHFMRLLQRFGYNPRRTTF